MAWLLQNPMCPAWSPHPTAPRAWLGYTFQPGGGLERCVWGEGPEESDPHCTAVEEEPTPKSVWNQTGLRAGTQEMVSGCSLPTDVVVPPVQGILHFGTRDQVTPVATPLPILGGGESHQPPHLGNGLLPPRASRKKDPRANKRQTELGTLRQLHGGWVGGWMDGRTDERAGGQAGRQAVWGRSLWSLANAGAYCRGFSRADPGTSSGVAGENC